MEFLSKPGSPPQPSDEDASIAAALAETEQMNSQGQQIPLEERMEL